MRFLSLFAGIGGFDLGLERAGMQCVGQVEINPFCQAVLAYYWPHVRRVDDIRKAKGDEFGAVDLICGGAPCQPVSNAGKRRGTKDDRWLWPEAMRIVREAKPAWVLFENVRGLTTLEQGVVFESLLVELEGYGYEVQSFVIPACAVDAPHRRDRVWIVAYTPQHGRIARGPGNAEEIAERREPDRGGVNADVADADTEGLQGQITTQIDSWKSGLPSECSRWPTESRICRVSNGIPGRVDRLQGLGNAVVPQVVEEIGRAIMKAEIYK